MDALLIDEDQAQQWNDFVRLAPRGHILQTYQWGQFKGEFGWQPRFWAVQDGGRLMGVMLVQIRRLPLGLALAYSPRGPLVHPEDSAVAGMLLDAATADARSLGASILKVDPLVEVGQSDFWYELFGQRGFKPSGLQIQPRKTVITDISGSDEEVLARFERTHRYNVRLAGRREVSVAPSEDFDTFYMLLHETSQRERFLLHSREYFARMYELMHSVGLAQIVIAQREGQALAAGMVFLCGKHAYYPYGGSAAEGREHKAAQALQWGAMQWARAHGALDYDFWGLPVTDSGVLAGVGAFKKGFGGRMVEYEPARDYAMRGVKSRIFRTLIWLQIRWRNLRTHGSLTSPLGES
jgi:peptidoglycan pentaglycine glycine transferase (the first glycine)